MQQNPRTRLFLRCPPQRVPREPHGGPVVRGVRAVHPGSEGSEVRFGPPLVASDSQLRTLFDAVHSYNAARVDNA